MLPREIREGPEHELREVDQSSLDLDEELIPSGAVAGVEAVDEVRWDCGVVRDGQSSPVGAGVAGGGTQATPPGPVPAIIAETMTEITGLGGLIG